MKRNLVSSQVRMLSQASPLREAIRANADLSVHLTVRRLGMKRLRDQLAALAEQELHAELQRAECKAAEEGRHDIAVDRQERKIKVNKLKPQKRALHHRGQARVQNRRKIPAQSQRRSLRMWRP